MTQTSGMKTSLHVVKATHQDAAGIASVHQNSFASNANYKAYFPTEEAKAAVADTLKAATHAEIDHEQWEVQMVKETEHGDMIVAYAKWTLPYTAEDGYQDPVWTWPDGSNMRAISTWLRATEVEDYKIMGDRPCYRLSYLATDPAYERQRAACMLPQWSMSRSREEGIPIYLQSTVEATPLYTKRGFRPLGTFAAPLHGEGEMTEYNVYRETSCLFDPQAYGAHDSPGSPDAGTAPPS